MISIFPGKITNIFDSAREAQKLVEAQNIKVSMEGYRYIEGGILDYIKSRNYSSSYYGKSKYLFFSNIPRHFGKLQKTDQSLT